MSEQSTTVQLSVTRGDIIPSAEQVSEYQKRWDTLTNYKLQESSLNKLFTKTYPKNVDMDDVLIKVCALNDFYSTNIFSPFTIAQNIVEKNIDQRLAKKDLKVVNEIALVKVNDHKTRNFYSFATKYCSHHFPDDYPIYDNFVDKMLMYFRKKDKFANFKKSDLKNYEKYHDILIKFKKFYNLEKFTLKEIDRYLWQVGKEYFPKNYKPKK